MKQSLRNILSALLLTAMMGAAQAAVPHGTSFKFTHTQSAIYPGTGRTVEVYVPAQYVSRQPACLLVCMDGVLYDAIAKIDTLIAAGDMPVTIGVFVQPGVVKDAGGEVVRYNRSREFDTPDGTWARFLFEEILPQIEGRTLSDGRVLHISPDANDHAITGASSGGICAFCAAWFRPDLFSRVYSAVGTFVAMRGGNQLPALVRKTDPKPLRIFLQDGENDAWNPLFGSWWEYNRLMMSALQFAGYEVDAAWDKGVHSIRYGTLAFSRAMRFLWKGWPERVATPHSSNDMLADILADGCPWTCLGEYSTLTDTLFTANTPPYPLPDGCNAGNFAIAPDHRTAVQSMPHSCWLTQYVIDGGRFTCGQPFYWLHSPAGEAMDGAGPMAYDTLGNLYAATQMGVQVCDQNGRVRAILSMPGGKVERLAFKGHTLYIVCGGKVYSRIMATEGYDQHTAPIATPSQGQG